MGEGRECSRCGGDGLGYDPVSDAECACSRCSATGVEPPCAACGDDGDPCDECGGPRPIVDERRSRWTPERFAAALRAPREMRGAV